MHVKRTYEDDSLYDALFDEALREAEEYGTELKIPAAVDAALDRHDIRPDGCGQLRDTLIKELTDLIEFPCRADFGPTIRCRFMAGHEDEELQHEPRRWSSDDPLTQELAEDMYLLEADPEAGR